MLAKMIDKIVSLKETKIFEIGGPHPAPRRPPRLHQRQRPR